MSADIAADLIKIADASRRADGSDIPLGEQCRKAAATIERLTREANEAHANMAEAYERADQNQRRAEAAEAEAQSWWESVCKLCGDLKSAEAALAKAQQERDEAENSQQDFRLQNDREWKAKVDHQKDRAESLSTELAKARETLEPFSEIAGLAFMANHNRPDKIVSGSLNNGTRVWLTAGEFFDARAALAPAQTEGDTAFGDACDTGWAYENLSGTEGE